MKQETVKRLYRVRFADTLYIDFEDNLLEEESEGNKEN